eukprot:TRINITY_DN91902_c0_g1_i1.p1 TRINITY_DN91902_c0_g1~~TRINITY_DN91902_c0_g1_i1.p1  ORF type:complete len:335 (+),score=55.22 TRINITY_DN91902_c0_g1_i1:64-1068(+)
MASKSKQVIGITGPTRCGKGRVVKMVTAILEREKGWNSKQVKIIGQDDFWRKPIEIVKPDGAIFHSEEEAECHDFDQFLKTIELALAQEEVRVVIVEGFTIVHDARVARLCDNIFLLDVSRENTILRRSAQHAHNPNPKPRTYCEEVIWPAHERYMAHAGTVLADLGMMWTRLDANDNASEMLDSQVQVRADRIYTQCFISSSTDVDLPQFMYFESAMNGLVLDIDMAKEEAGAQVVMWGKEDGQNQKWRLTSEGYLESALNGLVLTFRQDKLVMWPKEAGDYQKWRVTQDNYLECAFGGLVLDIDRGASTAGAKLVLWEKQNTSNQKWRFVIR